MVSNYKWPKVQKQLILILFSMILLNLPAPSTVRSEEPEIKAKYPKTSDESPSSWTSSRSQSLNLYKTALAGQGWQQYVRLVAA